MAFITVTNTFVNSTTADATQVNQNFTDLINGTSDGTKDMSINAFTAAGLATLSGSVIVGSSGSNTITLNGSVATDIKPDANNSRNLGSSTLGYASIYLGSAGGFTTRLVGSASSSYTITLPPTSGTDGYVLRNTGSSTLQWHPIHANPGIINYSLATSVNTNAMTITLNGADGNGLSGSNKLSIEFRNATSSTGTPSFATSSSSPSITIPASATLGLASAVDQWIHVYAQNNSGTIELAVAGNAMFDEGSIVNTTTISSGSTDQYTLYGSTGRNNMPIRYLGRVKSNQTVSGTYASNASEISLKTSEMGRSQRSEYWLYGGNNYGSTNTKIFKFSTVGKNVGSDITGANDATNGASVTINKDGIYACTLVIGYTSTDGFFGLTLNSANLTTSIASLNPPEVIGFGYSASAGGGGYETVHATMFFKTGDVIRPHGTGSTANASVLMFRVTKIGH